MKITTLLLLGILPLFAHGEIVLKGDEQMNLSGALQAISTGDYEQFLKFGTKDFGTNISKADFAEMRNKLKSKIQEGYTYRVIGNERWIEDNLMTHFLIIQFRSPDHKEYDRMLVELITVNSTPDKFSSSRKVKASTGQFVDITFRYDYPNE